MGSMPLANGSAPMGGKRPFRVIIVGCGVGGLAFSHAFQKAGIDHVVLEKGIIAPPWGASISMWAHGARILQQIDCLEALEAACLPLKNMIARSKDGKAFAEDTFFDMMVERNGYNCTTFERRTFLQIIHDQLPDKSFIKTGKRVTNVIDTDDGVRVEIQDGTVEEGDIVIGCDGVHSAVRELMWKNANATIPNFISAKEKTSLVTTYTALIGVSKTIPGLGIQDMTWVHNDKLSFLFNTQPDQTYFFVHFKLPQQRSWPHVPKFTQEDADKAAASVADHPVSDSLVFGEIWKNRIRGTLISLEEGVYDHWYFGRTALVGDSVHKVTPNYALGANCALEGVVVLSNEINKLHKSLKPGTRPSKSAITALFHRYQEARKPRMKLAFDASYQLTRLQTCDGIWNKITMMYLVPLLGFSTFANSLAELCAGAPKFDFIPIKYTKKATIPWKDEATPPAVFPATEALFEGKMQDVVEKVREIGAPTFGAAFLVLFTLVIFIWNMIMASIAPVASVVTTS
ncbi:FAD binding domain-containing protein [Lepidopterella palustris CBS 459.81]|uniref:FAD binding domain-containing protein n=1 Tax=Lepidopterella palustris CBS 459.81 TaxID=1314670 RepID=A0A8E2EI76_9PEZI|nr:FAD binding domain-containing protein [Lepidopterella palustris CBS 459.81]